MTRKRNKVPEFTLSEEDKAKYRFWFACLDCGDIKFRYAQSSKCHNCGGFNLLKLTHVSKDDKEKIAIMRDVLAELIRRMAIKQFHLAFKE